MSQIASQYLAEILRYENQYIGHSDWVYISQENINQFAKLTYDQQFIHIDQEKSKRLSPYGTTVAHGFYILSLVPHLTDQIKSCIPKEPQASFILNYGLDKVRFMNAVKVDSHIRAHKTFKTANIKHDTHILLKSEIRIEIQNSEKPACIANTLTLLGFQTPKN